MEGITVGVFGTDPRVKAAFENAVAKKSEAEGIAVFTRTERGRRYSLLDTSDYPARIQGYATIASMVDHALYFLPASGKLSAPDGELAVLLSSFDLPGTLVIPDGASTPQAASAALKGTSVAQYRPDERQSTSSAIDLSHAAPRADLPKGKLLIYVDRVFTVKGVGTVALGFVLSGTVSVHSQLRPVPGPKDLRADVRGIQVNDVDFDSAGRGIRVGLSLRGVEPKDLDRTHWFDDGTLEVSDRLSFEFTRSPFYKQEVASRDMHFQLAGEMVPVGISAAEGSKLTASLPWPVPFWEGMRGAIVDLNGGSLRVAGAANLKF